MAQKKTRDQTKLAAAALEIAQKSGWDAVTPKVVARRAKVSARTAEKLLPDSWAALRLVLDALDAETLDAAETDGRAWRDDLFEILMARFEIMESHKRAFREIAPLVRENPAAVPRFAAPFGKSMQAMLSHAGAPATPIHVAGLGGLYLWLLREWEADDTPDLSKTMAAVDKGLSMFEKACGFGPCARTG